MASPWLALPAGTDIRAVARNVHAAREGFLSTGKVDATLRRMVADSWRRCIERGTDLHAGPTVELTDRDLEEYRSGHPLAAAMPIVRRLLVDDAKDGGFIVALTDAGGRLLWVEGASGSRREAERIGFFEGATWSEDAAGTNAPGTALALDHPVQIFASEHLADPVTAWSCSAAPIHAPDGTLLGAIDLTGGNDVAAPHNLTLVRTAAAAIEAELRLRQFHDAARPPAHTPAATPADRDAAKIVGAGRPIQILGTGRPVQVLGTGRPAGGGPAQPWLRLLGHRHGELVTDHGETPLRLRHAEILLVLVLNPAGLSAEQLSIELHDRRTAPVTMRAELSRLRDLLARDGELQLVSRPYRLVGALDSDVARVRRLLHRGAYRRALAAYPGPVLPASQAPGVQAIRERLRRELRACLVAGGDADLLWAYAQTTEGSQDLEIWQACLRALPTSSRRIPVVTSAIQQLHDDLS